MQKQAIQWVTFILIQCFAAVSFAMTASESANHLQSEWAKVKYMSAPEQRNNDFTALIAEAENFEKQFPNDARIKTWHGTILSSYASFKGGLGALSKLKTARLLLEEALKLDPTVEKGFAHAVLGAMYYRVPAKPIGFKDMKKAQEHLLQALTIDPRSMDANYFYGEYMLKVGDDEAARQYLLQALDAPVRSTQEIADKGRREEIMSVLNTIDQG